MLDMSVVDGLLTIVRSKTASKFDKEMALRTIRRIETAAGVSLYKDYNVSRNPSEMARAEEEAMDNGG